MRGARLGEKLNPLPRAPIFAAPLSEAVVVQPAERARVPEHVSAARLAADMVRDDRRPVASGDGAAEAVAPETGGAQRLPFGARVVRVGALIRNLRRGEFRPCVAASCWRMRTRAIGTVIPQSLKQSWPNCTRRISPIFGPPKRLTTPQIRGVFSLRFEASLLLPGREDYRKQSPRAQGLDEA